MKRREFITLLGCAAAAWPVAARAQQSAMPVVGFVNQRSADASARIATPFRKGLNETGYVEGQNVTVEYHWLDGRYDRLPSLMADLVRRRVAVIATPGYSAAAQAAKAATTMIPIVFGVGDDPVTLGLVASLARPGGNATGINFFTREVAAKRLGLFHDLVPKAARIAVLVNPANPPIAEAILRDIPEAARAIGLQIQVLNASTSREIEAAFATIVRDRADALFIAPDGFFISRRSQFVTLASRDRIPTSCSNREMVEAGLLMSYGTDNLDMYHRVGVYTGQILKGANPADLPVLQSTKFEFVINLQTARALGLEVPNALQLLADEVIERRAFITLLGGAAAWPLAARAQQAGMPAVGFLWDSTATGSEFMVNGLRKGLAEAGFIEGRNLTIEYAWTDGRSERLSALAAGLVGRHVAVIVSSALNATYAAKAATSTIPVVFAVNNDPVATKLVASLNRPGGNLTGVYLTSALGAKRLGLMHEMVPKVADFAVLAHPTYPSSAPFISDVKAGARSMGLRIEVFNASTESEIDTAFAALSARRLGALLMAGHPLFTTRRERIIALAARYAVPTMYALREFTSAGGLITYGTDLPEVYRLTGGYAGRILRGDKPADLPVLLPTKFEMIINLRTAKALGLDVPDKLLALADEVIE